MKEHIPLLNFLRSTKFIVYVALFTVITLAPNTYFVYYSFSVFTTPYREIFGVLVSVLIAASIMIYTLRKNEEVALYFSIFEVTISGYYYVSMIGMGWALIPALGFTLILPFSVYKYTTEIDSQAEDIEEFLEKNPDKRPSDYFRKK